MFRTFSGRPEKCYRSAFLVHTLHEMFSRHAFHGLRMLVSCAPELRSRYPSSKLPWLYEDRSMQVTLPGVLNLCKILSALVLSERPRRIHCSAVVLSPYRRETPCSTKCSNDTGAEFHVATSSNMCPTPAPFTRWLRMACFCIGGTRGSHNLVSRGIADRFTTQRMLGDKRFLENLGLCREYVPYR